MDDTMQLRGIELRYVVTMHLLKHGPASISELAEAVAWQGFAVAGRASKSISDALRWEMGYGGYVGWDAGFMDPVGCLVVPSTDPQTRLGTSPTSKLSLRGGHIDASQTS
jgi:hypothetical protein